MNVQVRGLVALCCVCVFSLPSSVAKAANWTEVSTNNEACVHSQFLDESTGFASQSTKIRRTDDSGATWADLGPLGNFWGITGYHFFDKQSGLLFAGNPTKSQTKAWVWHTTDGGQNWTQGNEIAIDADRVAFFSATEGYAHGRKKDNADCSSPANCNFIYWTSDGGQTWTEDTNQAQYAGSDVVMVSKTVGFKTSGSGIYRTDDSGATWTFQHKPSLGTAHTPVFFNDQVGFAMNTTTSELLYTSNGGTTWTAVTLGSSGNRYGKVAFKSATEAFALVTTNTNKRQIWRTGNGGATWTLDTIPSAYELNNGWGCAVWVGAMQYAFSIYKLLRVGTPTTGGQDAGPITDSGSANDAGVGMDGSAAVDGNQASGDSSTTITDSGAAKADAGTVGGGGDDSGGCAVALSGMPSSGLWLLLAASLLLIRRRRRRGCPLKSGPV